MLYGNTPLMPTGYGQQIALLAPRLAKAGYDVAIASAYGLFGTRIRWQGIPIYPGGVTHYGADVLAGHARHFRADLVISLLDVWAADMEELRDTGIPVANWLPADCKPLSRMDRDHLEFYESAPIAMSRFGFDRITEAGFYPLYVPHSIDCSVFTPGERETTRAAMGVPQDAFIIGMNAANKDQVRKGFFEQWAAFAELHARHPDTLMLVHTQANGDGAGQDLGDLAEDLGIKHAVMFSHKYEYLTGGYTPADLAAWYRALDLYSGCAWGEGFGLPIVEAQACGVPVVVTDAASMTELCGAGWKVPGERFRNPAHRAEWRKPIIGAIEDVYEDAYNGRGLPEPGAARAFAVGYDTEAVFAQHWKPALEELGEAADRWGQLAEIRCVRSWPPHGQTPCPAHSAGDAASTSSRSPDARNRASALLIVRGEPGNPVRSRPPVQQVALAGQLTVVENEERYGALGNPWHAFESSARPGPVVIGAEDDPPVADDIHAQFAGDAHHFAGRKGSRGVRVPEMAAARRHPRRGRDSRFSPDVWGTWADQWPVLRDDWDFDYRHKGWDWRISEQHVGGWAASSRAVPLPAQVTGKYGGTHITPALRRPPIPAVAAADDARDYFRNAASRYDLAVHCAAIVGGRAKIEGAPLALGRQPRLDAACSGGPPAPGRAASCTCRRRRSTRSGCKIPPAARRKKTSTSATRRCPTSCTAGRNSAPPSTSPRAPERRGRDVRPLSGYGEDHGTRTTTRSRRSRHARPEPRSREPHRASHSPSGATARRSATSSTSMTSAPPS